MTASSSSDQQLRLLAVHAHPDDESSKGAATMAMYAAAGVDVMVATCTDGSRGDIQNPAMEDAPHPKRDMAGARRLEMANAAAVLGIQQRWLGFVDSGLPEGDPLPPLPPACFALQPLERATAPLVRLVRSFKPHVILSYDENGGYPHPDHIMAHKVAVEAFDAAGDPDRYPGMGEPWAPSKLYYDRAFSPERFRALHFALEEAGLQSPYAERLAAWLEADAEGHTPVPPDTRPPPRWIAATSSRRATTHSGHTAHRSIPSGSSSQYPRICSARRGRGRTTPSSSPLSRPSCRRRTCSRG